MLNLEEQKFLDTLARAIAWESMEQTGKGDYGDMLDYVIHEATYEDIVLTVFDKKYMTEQTIPRSGYGMYKGKYLDTDIERARRLSAIENMLAPIVGMGVAMFASGAVDSRITTPLAQKMGGFKPDGKTTNYWGGFVKGAGSMLAWSAITAATTILLKFLTVSLEKSKSVCRGICKKQYAKDHPNYRLTVNLCQSRCKLQGLTTTVNSLRNEITKCSTTPNPEKCQTNLVKIVGKYNDLIAEETQKIKSYTQQLKDKASIEDQTGR